MKHGNLLAMAIAATALSGCERSSPSETTQTIPDTAEGIRELLLENLKSDSFGETHDSDEEIALGVLLLDKRLRAIEDLLREQNSLLAEARNDRKPGVDFERCGTGAGRGR